MDTKFRVIFGFLLVANTLLLLALANFTLEARQEVRDLQAVLATKEELLNLTHVHEADVLEQNCTSCHAENKFSKAHGSESDMLAMIAHMQQQAGSHIDPKDMDAIHASLELLQCNTCHDQKMTRKLALKPVDERDEVIRAMLKKSDAPSGDEEVQRVARSYQQLYGF